MSLELVDKMDEQPAACLFCGGAQHVDVEHEGRLEKALRVTGIDVNWGDTVYVCMECMNIISDLIDRVPQEEHHKLLEENRKLNAKLSKLEAKHAKHVKRTRAVVRGEKARKELSDG